eukprot:scaffold2078_cov207-Chaetoceros_neogracile.AAC.2
MVKEEEGLKCIVQTGITLNNAILCHYSGTTDIVTLGCSYIPDIDTSKSLNTAYGAKDQTVPTKEISLGGDRYQ